MTKLCRDCKWMRNPGKLAECWAPYGAGTKHDKLGMSINESPQKWTYCHIVRGDNLADYIFGFITGTCCLGRWWEPKS